MNWHRGIWKGVAAAIAALGAASLAPAGCAAGDANGAGGAGATGAGGDAGAGAGGDATGGGGTGGGGPIPCDGDEDCGALDGPCAEGLCVSGACAAEPTNEFGSCNDGRFCTENDVCVDGQCVGGTGKFCPSSDSCHVGYCEEQSDACVNVPGNDGGQCDDGDACTGVGSCMGGTCQQGGSPTDCSIYDGQCSAGACDPQGGCYTAPANEGAPCDDGLFCTIGERCVSGQCTDATPNPCGPPSGCWIASCDETADQCTAAPGNDGAACDDQSPCTDGTTCSNGACVGGVPVNEGMACDDSAGCTTGEFCTGGACGGGTGPTVYFGEDFSDNAAGWALDPEWGIGPAQASVDVGFGADPALDHTPTADNGVAGVVIGGDASPIQHSSYYLTSPPFNTASAVGPVILGFHRWLNSEADPFMNNSVEVWNGAQWVTLWNSFQFIHDAAWTFASHDVTAHKNAAMRIRFGFRIQLSNGVPMASWNVDDVLVASAACP